MKTTLEKYCEIIGWKGGTIHQAKADFIDRSQLERDHIVGKLVDSSSEISDLNTVGWFTQLNIDHIQFSIVKLKEATK